MKPTILISCIILLLSSLNGYSQKSWNDLYRGEFSQTEKQIMLQSIMESLLLSPNSNSMDIYQSGNRNSINITQNGLGINSVTRQLGDYNSMDISVSGSNIDSKHYQKGNNNTINQSFLSYDADFELIQLGDNNCLKQHTNHKAIPGMQIHQKGNNMKLIIK